MIIRVKPEKVCVQEMILDVSDTGIINNFYFRGGCNGNLSALAKIMKGKNALEVAEMFKDNDCNNKGTSCMAELAKAIIDKLG